MSIQQDLSLNEGTGYGTKQSNSEVPVMLGLWGIRSTASLLQRSLWPGIVAPDRAQSMGEIELFA